MGTNPLRYSLQLGVLLIITLLLGREGASYNIRCTLGTPAQIRPGASRRPPARRPPSGPPATRLPPACRPPTNQCTVETVAIECIIHGVLYDIGFHMTSFQECPLFTVLTLGGMAAEATRTTSQKLAIKELGKEATHKNSCRKMYLTCHEMSTPDIALTDLYIQIHIYRNSVIYTPL